MSRKQLILDNVEDLVSDFLYYDRKEDEELPRGSVEEAIKLGEISSQEIIDHFSKKLEKSLSPFPI